MVMALVIIVGMILDLVLIIGTFYLIDQRGWSLWWIVFLILVTQASFNGTKQLMTIANSQACPVEVKE